MLSLTGPLPPVNLRPMGFEVGGRHLLVGERDQREPLELHGAVDWPLGRAFVLDGDVRRLSSTVIGRGGRRYAAKAVS
jgi:hypothetical protein